MEIRGAFYKTISQNLESGEAIFTISPYSVHLETNNGLITCMGKMVMYQEKTPLLLIGEFVDGIFQVSHMTCKDKSLCERLIHFAIAPSNTAREKIAEFVSHDLYKFCKAPNALEHLEYAIPNKGGYGRLFQKIKQLDELETFTSFLYVYEVPLDQIEVLITKDVTIASLRKNPYHVLLFSDIEFSKMDALALDLGFSPYSKERLKAIALYALRLRLKSGHTAVTIDGLYKNISYLLEKSRRPIQFSEIAYQYVLTELAKQLVVTTINNTSFVQLKKIYDEELLIAAHVQRLSNQKVLIEGQIDVDRVEQELGFTYQKGQREAFELLRTSGIKILTGRPGTGKTAVIKGLISEYMAHNKGKVVQLSATTGRAAQVMGAACGDEAKTVHKMLDIRPFSEKEEENSLTGKGENNPILADFVIVDEFSMEGLEICSILLSAIKNDAILLLVGDDSQLQSVEYGNVLQDLIESHAIPTYRLTEVMRQKGLIPDNAWKINTGNQNLEQGSDFQIFHLKSEEDVYPLLMRNIDVSKSKVLCSVKSGPSGVHAINKLLQEETRLERPLVLSYGSTNYYKGDSIIVTETNYELGVFNGDMGTIEDYNPATNQITLIFQSPKGESSTIFIERSQMKLIVLAYSITTHKSQGSEWEDVHVVLPETPKVMLTRRLLYTAVTRARKRVFIYSINGAHTVAINNNNEEKRITILKDRLAAA